MTTYDIVSNTVPADDEWFELEVDNDKDLLEVVASAGYNPKGWKYLGPEFTGKKTYRGKLVRLGYVPNLAEPRDKVDKMGYRLVEGQARESFRAKFPKPDGKGSIAFGGSEWRASDGPPRVPCLIVFGDKWGSSFFWSNLDFNDHWRWLVVDK